MSKIIFNELNMIDLLKAELLNAFNTDVWKETLENEMLFVNSNSGTSSTFPVTYMEIIDPVMAQATNDSSGDELYTQFRFSIEQYNIEVEGYDEVTLGIMINHETKKTLLEKSGLVITSNRQVPSQYEGVYRRVIEGTGIYNNKTKIFYK